MTIYRTYVPASGRCRGSATAGAREMMTWIISAWGARGIRNLGIYACRSIRGSSDPSVHGAGRALDAGVTPGDPDGQLLADFLVSNSGELGVQCVIYRRRIWSAVYPDAGWRVYSGSNPHYDHLHIELSPEGGRIVTVELLNRLAGTPVRRLPKPVQPTKKPTAPPPQKKKEDDVDRLPVLKRGARGQEVRNLQALLVAHGRQLTVDGDFGPGTERTLKAWQAAAKAPGGADGVAGAGTWGRLLGLR